MSPALDLVYTLVRPTYGGSLVATPHPGREWLQTEADRLPAEALEPAEVPDLVALREAPRAVRCRRRTARRPLV